MQRVVVVVGVLLAAAVCWQGYRNARAQHPLDGVARDVACQEISRCSPGEIDPVSKDTGPFVRRYLFRTGSGDVTVQCRWSALMFGKTRCAAEAKRGAGSRPPGGPGGRYPDELGRGPRK